MEISIMPGPYYHQYQETKNLSNFVFNKYMDFCYIVCVKDILNQLLCLGIHNFKWDAGKCLLFFFLPLCEDLNTPKKVGKKNAFFLLLVLCWYEVV